MACRSRCPQAAQDRGLTYVDATCPLVSKVHRQAQRLIEEGRHILFIGHAGHPEVIGTFGQVPAGSMTLIETVEDAEAVAVPTPDNLAFLTQTTLSVDDTAAVVGALQSRFPAIRAPKSEDICYATSNRQAAVKAIAEECERMLVIGAPNSSNSLRLAEVAERMGVPSRLIERAADIDWDWLGTPRHSGPYRRCIRARAAGPRGAGCSSRAVRNHRGNRRPHARAHDLQAPARACRLVDLPNVEIFTDGACRGNPGPGGWGALLRTGPKERELSGGEPLTTNNRMELTAAIKGLEALKRPCRVQLYTDSNYVRDGITKWIHGWRRNGWRTADKKPVKNAELWQELLDACTPHRVEWHWVKGHSGHPENDRVDALACAEADKLKAGRLDA